MLTEEELFSPHLPKVVTDQRGHALYFSRHPLPYQRQYPPAEWLRHHQYYRHLGLYAYRPDVLRQLTPPTPRPWSWPKAWSSSAGWKPASLSKLLLPSWMLSALTLLKT
ncbi:MAG: hypothetical protein WKG07_43050 [Hymenobacter sp.]